MKSGWFAVGAIAGALGVALGAFGAHALKARVTEDLLAVFETGVRYQMYHALALLAVGWAATRGQEVGSQNPVGFLSPAFWCSRAACIL